MQNLAFITEQIAKEFEGHRSVVLISEQIGLTDSGLFDTGRNKLPIAPEGLNQLAGLGGIPRPFFQTLEPDLKATVFNRRFQARLGDPKTPKKLRGHLNNENMIIGFDSPDLMRLSPLQLMKVVHRSLPEGLTAEQIGVGGFVHSGNLLHLSLYSPQSVTEPVPGDVINGGVDIVHHLSGEAGTQVHCYLRRLVCSNGATAHLCDDSLKLRARRLNSGLFGEQDMLNQIGRLLHQAWLQIDDKLAAIKSLTDKKRFSLDFLREHRTRFSLNEQTIKAIKKAINQDELKLTGTQYDLYNAVSRIATHYQHLTFRQRRTLSHIAGEISQQDVHTCDKCGSFVDPEKLAELQKTNQKHEMEK